MRIINQKSTFANQEAIKNLKKENQILIQKNHNKSEFIANIAHEIRGPLGAVVSYSNLIKDDYKNLSEKDFVEYTSTIANVTQEAIDLMTDLLDISQVNSGKFNIHPKYINIRDAIDSALRINKFLAIKNNITLKMDIEQNLPLLYLDSKRMKQILTNLISNSIKYSNNNKTITIKVCSIAEGVEINIIDQGLGMDERELSTALKRYGTVENENSSKVDSFGIGLDLIQNLVEAQNGEFLIKSKKNVGTSVIMVFRATRH